MSKIVEPPVLMSKVLTFVLATSIVVLGALGVVLIKMIPLERPQVFFLVTPKFFQNMTIIPMTPDTLNQRRLDTYKKGFIREYVIARNTLYSGLDASITRDNWSRVIKPWSSSSVFADMAKTRLYKKYEFTQNLPTVSCDVNFPNTNAVPAVVKLSDTLYEINFAWICKDENIGGQTTQKNYKIKMRIQSNLNAHASKTLENLQKLRDNPLGIQVVEYVIYDNKGDPLDSKIGSW